MRVVAGTAKGRPLKSVESRSVRPTSDKVKEAMFGILESEAFRRGLAEPGYLADVEESGGFPWARVLDLYAGSGSLGIEALSRGARHADFVEMDGKVRRVIAENLEHTGLAERSKVHGMRVEAALSTLTGPYDLILLDPPYDEPALDVVFGELCGSRLVGESTFVVLEHARRRTAPAGCGQLSLLKTRYHGQTGISIYAVARQE